VFGDGRAGGETRWDLGDGVLRIAVLRVESMPELSPGGRAVVRLRPVDSEAWQHLARGDVIALHERRAVAGVATVIECAGVGEARPRDR
jgi:hypothetical protein